MTNIKPGKVCRTHEDFTVTGYVNGHLIISEVPDTMISSKRLRNVILNTLDAIFNEYGKQVSKTTLGKKIKEYALEILEKESEFERLLYADHIRKEYKKIKEGEYDDQEDHEEPESLTYLIYKLVELIIHFAIREITEKNEVQE